MFNELTKHKKKTKHKIKIKYYIGIKMVEKKTIELLCRSDLCVCCWYVFINSYQNTYNTWKKKC